MDLLELDVEAFEGVAAEVEVGGELVGVGDLDDEGGAFDGWCR
ncbi:hypothetical protein [Streptomyces sp. MA15]|nr:hypothetical protein [Streptomyces sp. MA15]MDN3270351.1 hypothetical protein [Streptomyces sp. MA15]